jgi:hypothetical protein
MTHTTKVNTNLQNILKIPFIQAFQNNPRQFVLENFNERHRRVLNSVLYLSERHATNYVSQEYLAKYAGYKCRKTGNRVIKKFDSVGIIEKKYRHLKTCLYKTNDIFDDIAVRRSLKDVLPALKWLPLKWLMVTTLNLYDDGIIKNVPQYKEDILKALSAKKRACTLACVCAYAREKCYDYSRCLNNDKLHLIRAEINDKKREKEREEKEKILQKEKEVAKKELIQNIINQFGFDEKELIKLSVFTDDILDLAQKKMTRTLSMTKLTNAAAYFFSLCRGLKADYEKAKLESKVSPVSEKNTTTGMHKDIGHQTVPVSAKSVYKHVERDWKESWRLPAGDLAKIRSDGLSRVPPSFRPYAANLFDQSYKQAYKDDVYESDNEYTDENL